MENHVCLWEWDSVRREWVRKPAVVFNKRMTSPGLVIAGSHNLYWIKCNPSAGNSLWEISDDLDGLSETEIDEFHTTREGHTDNFLPPIPFAIGIYLKTFSVMTSMTFGYV